MTQPILKIVVGHIWMSGTGKRTIILNNQDLIFLDFFRLVLSQLRWSRFEEAEKEEFNHPDFGSQVDGKPFKEVWLAEHCNGYINFHSVCNQYRTGLPCDTSALSVVHKTAMRNRVSKLTG